MTIVKFTGTVLPSIGKKGVLTPDSNGYYTFIVGGLNCFNSAGEYYTAKGATQLFENSSHLMRRISGGSLFGELGHPKKDPDVSMEDFYRRVLTIDERNICCHFSEVWLDFGYGKENPEMGNPDLVAIMAKVKPSGVHSKALEDSIANTQENVAFSIRGITENKLRSGRVERTLTQIVTWDRVVEPGIKIANKWASPVLEELSDISLNTTRLLKVANESHLSPMATESSRVVYREVIEKYTVGKKHSTLLEW
jgi:hypothetical protein